MSIDAAQLTAWFEAHAGFLHSWLRLRLGSQWGRIDPEDLLQDVWLRASRLDASEPIREPRAWLLRIAGFVLQEAMRGALRRVREVGMDIDDSARHPPAEVTSITARVARSDSIRAFGATIDALDEADRHLLCWHAMEERPLREVAERLGIGVEAATKRWQRLRANLREQPSAPDWL